MAGGQERVLRRRIKSVESTKKITRAMELIAATRVVKALERANAARPYSVAIGRVVSDMVAAGASLDRPLLQAHPEAKRAGYIVITSDRGLCGAYNSSVIRLAERQMVASQRNGDDYLLVCVGTKGQSYFTFRDFTIDAAFAGVTDRPEYRQAKEIAAVVADKFASGELSSVDLVFTEFISVGTQQAVCAPLLPITPPTDAEVADGPTADYEYEPSPDGILDVLLPRYLESRLYSALLDASASEHAARQRAMKAATDNAEELKKSLTRIMNRARQDSITTEIMEIVGGAEALKQGKGDKGDLLVDRINAEHLFDQNLDRTDPAKSMH